MQQLESYLEPLLLEDIIIKTDDKVLKRGKLKIYNTKQFYLRLTLQTQTSIKDKLYEIPYPFSIEKTEHGIKLDYKISSFVPAGSDHFDTIRTLRGDASPISRLYDKYMYILPSSKDGI